MKLQNYARGKWVTGEGKGQTLFNAINGEETIERLNKINLLLDEYLEN